MKYLINFFLEKNLCPKVDRQFIKLNIKYLINFFLEKTSKTKSRLSISPKVDRRFILSKKIKR